MDITFLSIFFLLYKVFLSFVTYTTLFINTNKSQTILSYNLSNWGVITDVNASRCVFCGLGSESDYHLFVSCNQISPIWYAILRWLGVEWVSPRGNLGLFEVFLDMSLSRKID
jgi:hypothetical protein